MRLSQRYARNFSRRSSVSPESTRAAGRSAWPRSQRLSRRLWPARWFCLGARSLSVALCLWLLWIRPAAAHVDDKMLRFEGMVAGSHHLRVWTAPNLLRTGEIHVVIDVVDRNGTPVRNVLTTVTVLSYLRAEAAVTVVARPASDMQPYQQEAVLHLAQPGPYEMAISMRDATGAGGTVSFPIEVIVVPLVIRAAILSLILFSTVMSGWLVMQGRSVWSAKHNDWAVAVNRPTARQEELRHV